MTAVPALDPSYVQLLETIRRDEKVARALEIALEEVDRAMEEQIELCEIEAPTFAEEKRAARVAELMRAYGLTDAIPKAPCLRSAPTWTRSSPRAPT